MIKLQGRDIYAIHSDHLGTPRNVTDENQKNVWQANYSPFGKAEIKTEQITLNLRFPGQYEDEETGTYYNYFRDYDPGVGRYRTSDPIGLQGGLNTYAYVDGNPLSKMDRLGLLLESPPNTALYRALAEAGVIAVADGPEIGLADAAALGYIAGAVIGITYSAVTRYLDRPEKEDIDFLYNEIRLYKPNYTSRAGRTWDEHRLLLLDLYIAQSEYVRAYSARICMDNSNTIYTEELFERAESALKLRDDLDASLENIMAFLSPEGIYFPNEEIYRAERFAYELYLEQGGDLSFKDWYYRVRLKEDRNAAIKPPGYENPGHHDPSNSGPNTYDPSKAVLPKNHDELWENSVPDPSRSNRRWAKVGTGKNAIYHRFQDDGNGNWHWNGSTDGLTKNGKAREINLRNIPKEIKRM